MVMKIWISKNLDKIFDNFDVSFVFYDAGGNNAVLMDTSLPCTFTWTELKLVHQS